MNTQETPRQDAGKATVEQNVPGRQTGRAPRYFGPLLLLGGVLLGVAGTAILLPRLHPTPTLQVAHVDEPAEAPGEGNPGEPASIQLSAETAKTAGLRVEAVRMAPLGEGLTVPGTVEISPDRGVKVTPPASGKVTRLLVNPGDTVRAGQALAVLDSFEVAQAHAAVRQAEANLQQAQAGIQTAQADVEQAQIGIQTAQADVEQAQTRQSSAETALQSRRDLAKAGAFSQAPLQAAQAEVATAQSELLQVQTDLQAHVVVLQRAERLFKEELVARAELEQAQLENRQDQARVVQAKARVASAKQTLEREQRVFSGDLLTKQAVQTTEAEVRSGQGEVQKARQGIARAKQEVRRAKQGVQAAQTMRRSVQDQLAATRTTLYALEGVGHQEGSGGLITVAAPIAGVVTERNATQGEAVERTTTLLVIENLSAVIVDAHVPEKDVARVRVGQPVEVVVPAYPQQRFPGIVRSLAGHVNEKTRALAVRCLVENRNGRLRPEMFAQVTLGVGARATVLAVPLTALEEEGADRYVYIERDGKFARRKVQIGRTTEAQAEITAGLQRGDRIATAGLFVLKSEANKDKLKGDD